MTSPRNSSTNTPRFILDGSILAAQPVKTRRPKILLQSAVMAAVVGYGLMGATAQAAALIWTGTGNGIWDTVEANNWSSGGAATYADPNLDAVTFNNTGLSPNNSITITGTVSPTSVAFTHTSGTYTFSGGAIGGTASVTQSGVGGTVTFNNANTYSGGTTLTAGRLNINNASAIGSGALTISAGTTIDNSTGSAITLSTNNTQAWNGDFTFAGTQNLTMGTGAVTLSANRTVTVAANTLTVGGLAGGTFTLGKSGTGTLSLSATGTVGVVNINQGALLVSDAGALGNTASNTINNNTGAALQLSGNITLAEPLSIGSTGINSAGAIQNVSGTNTLTGGVIMLNDAWIGADTGSTLNITTVAITGNKNVTFAGGGNINLGIALGSTVNSITKVNNGTLTITVDNSANTTGITVNAGTLALNGAGKTAGNLTINPTGILTVTDNSVSPTNNRLGGSSKTLTLAGATFNYTANATSTSSENTAGWTFNAGLSNVNITPGAGSTILGTGSLSWGGGSTALITSAGLGASNTNTLKFSGTINNNFGQGSNTVGATTKSVLSRMLVDNGTNPVNFGTYDAAGNGLRVLNATTEVNSTALSLLTGGNNNVSTTTSQTVPVSSTVNSMDLKSGGGAVVGANATFTIFSGGIIARTGNTGISGGYLAASNAFAIHTLDNLTISSVFAGGQTLIKNGSATLTLSGANNLLGVTYVNQGTLLLNGGANTLPYNQELVVNNGGTLDLNGNNQAITKLQSQGTVAGSGGTITSISAATLYVNENGNSTFAGALNGAVSLVKGGNNTLTFVSPSATTGSITVASNTLQLRDAATLLSVDPVNGFAVNYATLNIDNTGTLDLGNRISDSAPITLRGGTLTLNGRAATKSSETVGAVTVSGGGSTISSNKGGTNANFATLTLTSLTRTGNATVSFSGTNLGNPANDNSAIFITGQADTTLLGTWAVVGAEFASYRTTTGVGALNTAGYVGYSSTNLVTAGSSDNVRITANPSGPITTKAVNSLNINTGAVTITAANTLTVTSGGLLIQPGGTAITGGSITAGDGTNPAELFIHVVTNNAVINSAITDNASSVVTLVKAGGNQLTLNLANSYGGGTVVNAGTLTFAATASTAFVPGDLTINAGTVTLTANSQIGTGTSNVTVAGGGNFNLATFSNAINNLTFTAEGFGGSASRVSGAGILTLNGNITASSLLNPAGTDATVANPIALSVAAHTISVDAIPGEPDLVVGLQLNGIISGGATAGNNSIVKTGAGTLQLASATNTFTGNIAIQGGVLSVDSDARLGAAASSIVITNNATFRNSSTLGTGRTLTISTGGGKIDVTSGATFTLGTAGQLIGSTALTKTGLGTLSITATNSTWTGPVVVNAGTLSITNVSALGTGTGVSAPDITVNNGGTYNLAFGSVQSPDLTNLKLNAGGLLYVSSNAITPTNYPTAILAGDIRTDRDIGQASDSGITGKTLSMAGGNTILRTGGTIIYPNIQLNSATDKSITLTGTGGSITLPGNVSEIGGGKLQLITAFTGTIDLGNGANFVTLSGTNTYTGGTYIQAGALRVSGSSSLPSTGGTTVSGLGTLALSDTNAANLDLSATGKNVTMQAGSTLLYQSSPSTPISAARAPAVIYNFQTGRDYTFSSSYVFKFGANGTIAMDLWGTNNLNGPISLADGVGSSTLTFVGGSSNIGSGTFVNGLVSDGTSPNVLTLTGTGGTYGTSIHLTNANNTYSGGTVWNAVGLALSATASQALGTGNVTVNGGAVRLNNVNNLASGKLVTVNAAGTVAFGADLPSSHFAPVIDPASTGYVSLSRTTNGNFTSAIDLSVAPYSQMSLGGNSSAGGNVTFTGAFTNNLNHGNFVFQTARNPSDASQKNFNFSPSSGSLANGTGTRSLTVQGGGVVTLGVTNSYTGGTNVTSGLLISRAASGAFGTGAVTLASGTLLGGETVSQTIANNVNFTAGGVNFTAGANTVVTFGGVLNNGTSSLTIGSNNGDISASGVVVLNSAPTGTGNLIVGSNGNYTATLGLTNANQLPTAAQLRLDQGVVVLDNVTWANFVGNRTAGYGNTIATANQPAAITAAAGGGLAAGTYFYKVVAVTDAGTSAAGTERSGVTAAGNLTLPISWSANTGALKYRVYRYLTTNSLTGDLVYEGNALSFSDNGIAAITPGVTLPTASTTVTAGTWFLNNSASGFAARTTSLAIGGAGTNASTFDRDFTLGSAARDANRAFYANAPVDLQANTTLTANRNITIAAQGPGLFGAAGTGVTQRISGNLSGTGDPTFKQTGFAQTNGPAVEVVLAGTNNWTGSHVGFNDNHVTAGPGGLMVNRADDTRGFIRFASPSALPSGNGGAPAWLAADVKNGYATYAGFMLTSAVGGDGAVYDLGTNRVGYKFLFGNTNFGGTGTSVIGATSDAGTAGTVTLQNSSIIAVNAGNTPWPVMLVRDGVFNLGTAGAPTTIELAKPSGAASTNASPFQPSNANGLLIAETGTQTIRKMGTGTLVLRNVNYRVIGDAVTDASAQLTWQIGSDPHGNTYQGALRETGTTASNSVVGHGLFMRGGVLELAANRTLSGWGNAINQLNMEGTGGGGFAAIGGSYTVSGLGTWTWGGGFNQLSANSPLILGSAGADNTVVLSNGFNLNGGTRTIQTIRGVGATPEGEISGVISNGSVVIGQTYDGSKALYFAGSTFVNGSNVVQMAGGTTGIAVGSPIIARNGSADGNNDLGTNYVTAVTPTSITLSQNANFSNTLTATVFPTAMTAGTVVFSGANTYTGLTTVNAGTLQSGVNNAINSGNAVTVSATEAGTATLNLAGFNQTIGGAGLRLGGGTATSAAAVTNSVGTSTLTLSGGATAVTYLAANNPLGATISVATVTLANAAQTFAVGDSANVTGSGNELTVSSAITAGASSALVKTGAGALKLDGAQGYDILTANGGTTNVNGALGIGSGTAVVAVNNSGTILKFGSVSQTLSSLTIGAGSTVIFTSGTASGSFIGGGKSAALGGGSAVVPEPGTLGLLLVGALGLLNRRRRPA